MCLLPESSAVIRLAYHSADSDPDGRCAYRKTTEEAGLGAKWIENRDEAGVCTLGVKGREWQIDNEKSLQSYLYILTRERTIDFLRKWERRRGALSDYENYSAIFDNFKEPEEIALANLQLDKAVSILSDMPLIYRRTLVLRVKGYSIREIAKITNSSESNVKTRIHRARAILLKSFDT